MYSSLVDLSNLSIQVFFSFLVKSGTSTFSLKGSTFLLPFGRSECFGPLLTKIELCEHTHSNTHTDSYLLA